MKPAFATRRATLRAVAADDFEAVAALLRDPDVRRYLCDDQVFGDEVIAGFLARSAALDAEGLGLWTIELDVDPVAGLVGLQPTEGVMASSPRTEGAVELLIALAPTHWGVGLAAEVVSAAQDHARRALGLTRLVAGVDAPNHRSHALMRRCGFTAIGEIDGPMHRNTLYEAALSDGLEGAPAL